MKGIDLLLGVRRVGAAQNRLGLNQKVFPCLKLRTVRSGTPEGAFHVVGARSVIRVGRFLHATNMDELPQLWDLLKGAMSLQDPGQGCRSRMILTRARARKGIFEAVPGITGLAQVQGINMSDPEQLAEVDRKYIETRSMAVDLRLIFHTLSGGGQGDAVRGHR